MKILSWNVAGLRARLKKREIEFLIFGTSDFDIVCLQETKCESIQVNLSHDLTEKYPYRYWNSTMGTSQRKGLSGTAIWSSIKPLQVLTVYEFDKEGRIIALEYDNFILINVYVPNSQKVESDRATFRVNWDLIFRTITYDLSKLYPTKSIIICGDLNVARTDNDIVDPKKKNNIVPGFLDDERSGIEHHLNYLKLIDVYRDRNPETRVSTYWSNFLKQPRSSENGWRIDYFLTSEGFKDNIKNIEILSHIMGSDHCPLCLEFD